MKVKPNTQHLLELVGINKEHAEILQGQCGNPTGRRTETTIQLAFDGSLIGWKQQFLYCIPKDALENN